VAPLQLGGGMRIQVAEPTRMEAQKLHLEGILRAIDRLRIAKPRMVMVNRKHRVFT